MKLLRVKIDQVKETIHTPREELGDLEELAASIKATHGAVQPITVDENLELVAGSRRLAASKLAGLDEIFVLQRHITDRLNHKEIELIENIHREDLTWQEECSQVAEIHRLYQEKYGVDGWSQRDTAQLLDRSVGGINRSLQLAEISMAIPEVRQLKTEDDAVKAIKKMEEKLILNELGNRMKQKADTLPNSVRIADHVFQIGDAFVGLEALTNNSPFAHLIEVDPPYAIDLETLKKRTTEVNDDLTRYTEWDEDHYADTILRLATLLFKKANKDCWLIFWFGPTWFCEVKAALQGAGWKVDEIPGIWSKGSGQTNAPDQVLARTYEPFFIGKKGSPSLAKQGRSNVFEFKPVPAGQKYHPTQRPVELMEELIETFTFPGSGILIPLLGSGSTLRAALKKGRSAVGWDLDMTNKQNFLLRVQEDSEKEIK
jgi:ParB/RepB/Spo0J family partition protein